MPPKKNGRMLHPIATKIRKPILALLMLLVLLPAAAPLAEQIKPQEFFKSLQQQLIQDGFDAAFIETLYAQPGIELETTSVSQFSQHREASLNYDQFLSRSSLRKAQAYMRQYEKELAKAEKEYGVDKKIVTAVILVETRLGAYTGNSSTLNTLSTMAALSDKKQRSYIFRQVSLTGNRSRKEFDNWADRKSKWAYRELKAFLKYTKREGIDPLSISGSYAGALGISQFMPSNINKLAKDGNRDGKVDLFDHADAIASIANFLKHHGWKQGLARDKKYKVLLKYNYSKYYANTLLDIADRLEG